ncbi:uncharacterized protein LOC122950000 [Acropora millepora]|uniref:uncharacterized protein LOC122950000 n=1 Tax=Acropora millepora TaxID=45264 RepID=UPI001CF19EBE|nr:uncharacterized protein LOC122950000 [Acropora millepora]
MDLLRDYVSDSNSSDEVEYVGQHDALETTNAKEEINVRSVRNVYLITYSQADVERFPTRDSFVQAVLYAFHDSPANIIQWCCCMEEHSKSSGFHFHMAIKLDKNQRWLGIKRFLLERCGISVHFSAIHRNYFSAWQYVTKEDGYFIQSEGHPDLSDGPPKTTKASIANKPRRSLNNEVEAEADLSEDVNEENSEEDQESKRRARKKKRMSCYDVAEIVVAKKIKTRTELLFFARQQKQEGKTDLAEFVINRGSKVVADVLQIAWEMEHSEETLKRQSKSRMELLYECLAEECSDGCNRQWITCAKDVLIRNGISVVKFARSVVESLDKGRGKYRNVMLVGPTNCGKTFLLNPLNVIYNTFTNPASSSFAWVGAEKAECIFLNDFRWSASIITWHDFLLLLEGQLVHLPAPKTHYAKGITFNLDTPIFATGKGPIVFSRSGIVDERETDMMAVRWNVFTFHVQIAPSEQKDLLPCGRCFAELVLGGK